MSAPEVSRAVPFRQFVFKVHSRCDLACDHCYVYEAADQGWRKQPRVMSRETAAAAGGRIAEHAAEHALPRVRIILHGGEPLLAGHRHLGSLISEIRRPLEALDVPPHVDFRIHSNGLRLDAGFCELFIEHGVRVGISLDGDREANDRHRRHADGRSSHAQVLAALELLRSPEYRHLYAGILCTIDLANDPAAVYRALAAAEPPRIDLLLPHANWDHRPPRPDGIARASNLAEPAYARWLLTVYELWKADGRPFGIRAFDSIHSTLSGGPPFTEALGSAPSDLLVIETDGAIEQVDSLKTAYDGAAGTGLRVQRDALDAAAPTSGIAARQTGQDGLALQCQACPVVRSCGGGLFAHRYDSASEDASDPAAAFRNPSVYCADLLTLISEIERREAPTVPASERVLGLSAEHVEQLASGFGDAAAIQSLNTAAASIDRAALAAVGPVLAERSHVAALAWSLIRELDGADPGAMARTIAHPFFRPWALAAIEDPDDADPAPFVGYALAAASRAELAAELPVPAGTAEVYLPGLGRSPAIDGKIALGSGGALPRDSVRSRLLTAPGVPDVLVEDLDELRDHYHRRALSRLTEAEAADWNSMYRKARELIEERYPEYAPGLSVGLRAVVPLENDESGIVSDTLRITHGAFGVGLPPDAEIFALQLLHEVQHIKLGVVLDLYDLHDHANKQLYYAPWRTDPRPLESLLQGIYAHVAVVDYWKRRVELGDVSAESRFAHWHEQTGEAIATLGRTGALTDLGVRFAAGLRATIEQWSDVRVSAEARDAARRAIAEHRAAYASLSH